jgi:xanthine dehydrogenase small subunit
MSEIAFLLNGTPIRVSGDAPTRTLLDFLRETKGLTGTKEGCNEGDCGACTVMVTDEDGAKALNSCILFLPQLNGKAVRTVEGLSGPAGEMHPVQAAMVNHHGSQCGFCTPGFCVSMAVGHMAGRTDHDTVLAGNLCRCTGYAPIIRAAKATEAAPVPAWMTTDAFNLAQISAGDATASGDHRRDGGEAPLTPRDLDAPVVCRQP